MLNYVRRWAKLISLKSPEIGSWKKRFCLQIDISQRIFYRSEKPRCQNLPLCIPFPNGKVFLQLKKRLCLMLCKTCCVFIGTPSSINECNKLHLNQKNFSVYHTNIRNLSKHIDALHTQLSMIDILFDIIGISQTKHQINKDYFVNVDIQGCSMYT